MPSHLCAHVSLDPRLVGFIRLALFPCHAHITDEQDAFAVLACELGCQLVGHESLNDPNPTAALHHAAVWVHEHESKLREHVNQEWEVVPGRRARIDERAPFPVSHCKQKLNL
jgi:hypothetical protein